MFLFYPYFNENWISKWLPEFKMLDYKVSMRNEFIFILKLIRSRFHFLFLKFINNKVSYENQRNFSQDNASIKKGSPARIFTNVSIERVELPANQGYVHCDECQKYTYKENKHCFECGKCTSKVTHSQIIYTVMP